MSTHKIQTLVMKLLLCTSNVIYLYMKQQCTDLVCFKSDTEFCL